MVSPNNIFSPPSVMKKICTWVYDKDWNDSTRPCSITKSDQNILETTSFHMYPCSWNKIIWQNAVWDTATICAILSLKLYFFTNGTKYREICQIHVNIILGQLIMYKQKPVLLDLLKSRNSSLYKQMNVRGFVSSFVFPPGSFVIC